MVLLAALLIFLVLATVTWGTAVALFHTYLAGPDLRQNPEFLSRSAGTIGIVALTSFVPFPLGYLLGLIVWWWAAKSFFELRFALAVPLFLILAGLSFVSRLVVLGALAF